MNKKFDRSRQKLEIDLPKKYVILPQKLMVNQAFIISKLLFFSKTWALALGFSKKLEYPLNQSILDNLNIKWAE